MIQDTPSQAVTFVDNHDTIRDPNNAINNDKLLAYSFILTHEGYPSVFWMDWYNFGLAMTGTPNGIAALVAAHEKYAAARRRCSMRTTTCTSCSGRDRARSRDWCMC